MKVPDPIELALLMAGILEDLGVTYVLGGSIASTLHGEPRATLDVDIVAALRDEHLPALRDRLGEEFYLPQEGMRKAVREHGSFNLIHIPTGMKVDVFIPPATGIHEEKWRRRQRVVLQKEPERSIWVTDPEDIVLQKLDWYRRGGPVSQMQWRDALGVLKVQAGRLDHRHLRKWAAAMGMSALLEKALAAAGIAEEGSAG